MFIKQLIYAPSAHGQGLWNSCSKSSFTVSAGSHNHPKGPKLKIPLTHKWKE